MRRYCMCFPAMQSSSCRSSPRRNSAWRFAAVAAGTTRPYDTGSLRHEPLRPPLQSGTRATRFQPGHIRPIPGTRQFPDGGGFHDVHPIVNATASAILHLANKSGANLSILGRKSPHRTILERLGGLSEQASYLDVINLAVDSRGKFTSSTWSAKARAIVIAIATAISGAAPKGPDGRSLLTQPFHEVEGSIEGDRSTAGRDNLFSYPHDAPSVHIRLGSIHSVKGETHTATLVLEFYYYDHHLSQLKPWLFGTRSGGLKGSKFEGERMLGRMKLHYVAMTRPSHLLCLAMRKSDALSPCRTLDNGSSRLADRRLLLPELTDFQIFVQKWSGSPLSQRSNHQDDGP